MQEGYVIGMPRRLVPVDPEAVIRARLGAGFEKQERLAAKAEVSQSTLSRIEAGQARRVETDTLLRLADTVGASFASLAGEGLDPADDPDFLPLRDGGTLEGGRPSGFISYVGSYRINSPSERGHQFFLCTVAGDCMAPRIEDGDKVVVDTSRAEDWRVGDTVAVRHDGSLLVKRVEALPSYPSDQPILAARDGTRIVPDDDTRVIGVVVEIRKKP